MSTDPSATPPASSTLPYFFSPREYGFESLENFPEMIAAGAKDWFGGNQTFIKIVIATDPDHGVPICWYKACKRRNSPKSMPNDHRFSIYNGVFSLDKETGNFSGPGSEPNEEYLGLISSHEFAILLFHNLFAALSNDSVAVHGVPRFEANNNEEWHRRLGRSAS